ncbi:MAG: 50S ribosomal protein L31e [Candidatus Aenigmarchaeota archaeon]|nr:50S ribosomal protein L31e [Candidatus Aenigmarchaeota archaeon]
MEERVVTINLRGKLVKAPRWRRSKLALKFLRERLKRIAKTEVKIDPSINKRIWSKGENPAKLRIKIVKIDEKTSRAELI